MKEEIHITRVENGFILQWKDEGKTHTKVYLQEKYALQDLRDLL